MRCKRERAITTISGWRVMFRLSQKWSFRAAVLFAVVILAGVKLDATSFRSAATPISPAPLVSPVPPVSPASLISPAPLAREPDHLSKPGCLAEPDYLGALAKIETVMQPTEADYLRGMGERWSVKSPSHVDPILPAGDY